MCENNNFKIKIIGFVEIEFIVIQKWMNIKILIFHLMFMLAFSG